jgi:hypothetical protein
MKENMDKIILGGLSINNNVEAIKMLKENPDKIIWYNLARNDCPDAIQLLIDYPEKIDWDDRFIQLDLSYNKSYKIVQLLQENQDKILWEGLSENPHIFTYDYDKMRENCLLFKEDLMKERFHPRNLRKFGLWGHEGGIDYEDE